MLMVIDCNGLFGAWGIRTKGIKDPARYVASMDEHGVDKTVIVSLDAMCDYTVRGNSETMAACEAYPDRLLGLCVVNPWTDMTDSMAELNRCAEAGMLGLRLSPAHKYSYSQTDLTDDLMDRVRGLGWPVWLSLTVVPSTPHGVQPPQAAAALAAKHPDIPFIITGVGYGTRIDTVRAMRDLPNTYIEISHLHTPFGLERMAEDIGVDRILLGTAFAIFYHAIPFAKISHSDLSEEDRAKVLGGNIAGLLKLGD
jgi:predicted TIM-barrel fold metal-dependent hydrolase